MSFDKQVVLERILQEAPILSNRKGEVEIEGKVRDGDDWVKKIKVPIYAYYFNNGDKDLELTYDKINSPIQTTPNSTLVEVYSVWEGDPYFQKLRRILEDEGELEKGEVIYKGPWIELAFNDEQIKRETRQQNCNFSFYRSSGAFERHFNKLAEELGYESRLINLREEKSRFFDIGAYAVQAPKMVSFSVNGEIKEGLINIRIPVGINLDRSDPTLSQILDIIENSYQRIQDSDLSDSTIYLN